MYLRLYLKKVSLSITCISFIHFYHNFFLSCNRLSNPYPSVRPTGESNKWKRGQYVNEILHFNLVKVIISDILEICNSLPWSQWINFNMYQFMILIQHLHIGTFNSSPKAVSGQRYPCPAWVVCDSGWGGAGQRPRRGRSPVEHRGNLSVHPSIHPSVRPSVCPSVCPAILSAFLLSKMTCYSNTHWITWRNDKRQYMDNSTHALLR